MPSDNTFDTHIAQFSSLFITAEHYLIESFKYISQCLEYELSILIENKLSGLVEITEKDKEILSKIDFNVDAVDFLQNRNPVHSQETLIKLSILTDAAVEISSNAGYCFSHNQRIENVKLLGHVSNLAFFLETLINRHLLFLRVTDQIDDYAYKSLDRAKIRTRLTYIFKDELITNTIHFNEITNLFNLRNKSVHFTPENAVNYSTTINALRRAWSQVSALASRFQNIENFRESDLSERISSFIETIDKRWFSQNHKDKLDSVLEKNIQDIHKTRNEEE